MSRVAWVLLLTSSLAMPAYAQQYGPCGGVVTHLWMPQPNGSITIGGGGSSPAPGNGGGGNGGGGTHEATPVSGGSSSGGGGGGGDAAVLVLLVVAAAALPIVVYAIDEDARPDVAQCWAVPEERVAFYGGTTSEFGLAPFLGARGLLNWNALGIEGGGEGSRLGASFDVHGAVLARIPPKQHIEFALGLGGRRLYTLAGSQSWFEVSLPQRYTPFRWNALEPGISFDLRPSFLWNPSGVWDVRLEAAIVFPLGPYASIDVGGRAYTFQGGVQGGAMLGMQLSL
ncbi:MAG TPA: hypothetical protein VFA20_19045 [Myxococcaceae bacterium]|nr:hypothetical protein [Myxococcaceae bacterium]